MESTIGTVQNELDRLTIVETYYCQQYVHLSLTSFRRIPTSSTGVQKKCMPCSIIYLAKVWGGVSHNFPLNNLKKGNAAAHTTTKQNPKQQSVINSFEEAQIHISAKKLFIIHSIEERTNQEKVFAYDTQIRAGKYALFI